MNAKIYGLLIGGACLGLLTACGSDEPPPPEPDADLVRETRSGQVIGFSDGDVSRWRGIPYAAAPVGELRWRAPQMAPRWQEVRQATQFGPACSQVASPLSGGDLGDPGDLVGSEDCLYLNITAPADADPNALLPVMIWIHGGGNMVGASHFYDFAGLVRQENLIVVSINYRMGLFGWFSHEAVRQTAPEIMDASANFGLLDIIASLEWVRDNIAAFGGDPTQVTIFGESAGGTNVASMLASRAAAGLFQGAIMQSGSTGSFSLAEAEATEEAADGLRGSGWFVSHWLEHYDALDSDGNPLPKPDPTDAAGLMRWLRALDADAVQQAGLWTESGADSTGYPFVARIIEDGLVIPSAGLNEAFRTGKTNVVPTIFGSNKDEMKLFFAFDDRMVSNWFGIQYFIRDLGRYERANSYRTRAWKAYGADQPALQHRAPTWVYRFDWDEEPEILWTDFAELLGAAHAFEIPFVSGNLTEGPIAALALNDDNRQAAFRLSEQMMAYWGAFARYGSPTAARDLPLWPGYRISSSFMVFDTERDAGLHLRQGVLSLPGLLEELATDEQVSDTAERCELAWRLYQVTPEPLPQRVRSYQQWQDGLCSDIPPQYRF